MDGWIAEMESRMSHRKAGKDVCLLAKKVGIVNGCSDACFDYWMGMSEMDCGGLV